METKNTPISPNPHVWHSSLSSAVTFCFKKKKMKSQDMRLNSERYAVEFCFTKKKKKTQNSNIAVEQ